jgi:hypothetical protein
MHLTAASQPQSPLPARWTGMDGAGDTPYDEEHPGDGGDDRRLGLEMRR